MSFLSGGGKEAANKVEAIELYSWKLEIRNYQRNQLTPHPDEDERRVGQVRREGK